MAMLHPSPASTVQPQGAGRAKCMAMLPCWCGRADSISPCSSGNNSCEHMVRWTGQAWQDPFYLKLAWVWPPAEQLSIWYHNSMFIHQATNARWLRDRKQWSGDWTGGDIIWYHFLKSTIPQDVLLASEHETWQLIPKGKFTSGVSAVIACRDDS